MGFAELLCEQEQWEDALLQAEAAIALNPQVAQAHYYAGRAQVARENWQAAIPYLQQAVTLDSQFFWSRYFWGEALLGLEDWQGAAAVLEAAMSLNPHYPGGYLALGVALLESRIDLERAKACLKRNLELQPNQPQGYFYLGKCSARQGRLDEALRLYRHSWELSQGVDCGLALAEILKQLSRWSEAIQQYRQVLLKFGESGEALFGLGQALAASKRPMEAIVEWRRAIGLGWNCPELSCCLAEAFASLERWDEAVLEWERLLELQPGNALVRRQRALALMGLGRWAESAQEWQQYWQMAPGSGEGTVLDFRPELGMYGDIPHRQELSLTGDLTVEFWLRLREWPQNWTNLVGKFVSDEQNEFCLRIKDGERGQWYYGRGTGCANPVTWMPQETIRLHQWVHIACVRKLGQSGQVYVDGVLQGEQDWGQESGVAQTEAPVHLMVSSRLHQFLDGQLSEVRVWNVARTGDEIRRGMSEKLEIEPGLVAVWSGSEDGVVVDAVGDHLGWIRQASVNGQPRPRVGVCSEQLSQIAADCAYTLAQLYSGFAQVELISSQFPQSKGQVSQPIQETEIPCHKIQVDDEEQFLEQALALVLAHPYEVVHLSQPRMPNIILGLLYKLLWDARVIVDIDNEELSRVEVSEPLDLGMLFSSGEQLPPLLDLLGQDWTCIAMGLAKAFDGFRVFDNSTSVATGGAEESLSGLVTKVLAVPGCDFLDEWVCLLQRFPAIEFVRSEFRAEGRFEQVQMNDDSNGRFSHHCLGEVLEDSGHFYEAILAEKNLVELQQPVTSCCLNLTRFLKPEKQNWDAKSSSDQVINVSSNEIFESTQSFIRPLLIFSHGDSIETLGKKLFLFQQISQKSVIHILKVSSETRDFLLSNNQYLNSLLILANCAKDIADQKDEIPGGYWKTLQIDSNSSLISLFFRSGFFWNSENFVKLIKNTQLFNKKFEPKIEVPSLKIMIEELLNGTEHIYMQKIEENVDLLIDDICSSAKRQRRLIGGILDIFILSKKQNSLRLKLQIYLEAVISEFKITTDEHIGEILLRKIDSCIYLLFELSEENSSDILAKIFKPAFDIMVSRHSPTVVLWRGLRHSFLKAIDLSQSLPTLIELAKITNTYDSIAFLAIHNAIDNRSSNAKFELPKTWGIVKNTFELPKKDLISLVRDLRRTVPTSSYISENIYKEIISELKMLDKETVDSEIILARFMLLLYSNCFDPRLLNWLTENYKEIGMSDNEKHRILAITGSDIPFINDVNENLARKGFHYKIIHPSKYSDLADYMEASLTQWTKNLHSYRPTFEEDSQALVSVILTTYNPDIRLLELSLKSIIFQSYRNLEIIIIDDCSSDNYSQMIQLLSEKMRMYNICNITYKRNKKNLGQYASRNIAIEISKGDFIAIQDDDDVSHPQRLEFQLWSMLHNSGLIATYTNHIRISENSRIMIDGNDFNEILGDAPVSLVCHKKVFDNIGFFIPTKTRGDVEFRLRMQRYYSSDSIEVIPQPLLLMRGGMNTVSSCKEYYFRSALKVWREVMKNLPIRKEKYTDFERWIPTMLQ